MGEVLKRVAVNGAFLSFVLLSSCLFSGKAYGQWVAGYTYKSKLTISGAQVCGAAALTNFPLLIQVNGTFIRPSPTGLINSANGYDIIFTASDGTTILSHQIDHYNGTTGDYAAWVRIPSLPPGSNTDIYMYYGNSAVVTDPSTQATWNVNFRTVYHFENNNLNDGTSNGINGTNNGTTNFATAKIGGGRDFDGTANYIQTTSTELQTANNFTLSTWFKTDAVNPTHLIWQGQGTENGWGDGIATPIGQEMHLSTGTCCAAVPGYLSAFLGHTEEQFDANGITAQATFTETTAWHHLVATYTNLSTAPSGQLYLDGALINTNAGTTAAIPRDLWDTNLRLGRPGQAQRFFDGKLDEVRILNIAESPDWICTEYNNQSNPSGFTSLTNRAPDLNSIEGTNLNYTEADPAKAITASITASDWDNATFTSATISISANYLSTEDVLEFTNAFGITGSWNSGTGVLTLSGTATIANYISALRSVTYQNTNISNPSPATRTVQFRVNDGTNNSVIVSRNITITNVNPFYNLIGNTAEISTHCFTITPALASSYGALWRKTPTTLQSSFEINFDARFSANGVVNDGGADGIVFVLQRDVTPPPSNVAGSPTDALGVNGVGLGYGGISPSIGVTFDTYSNVSQPNYDFISLSKDGNIATLLTGVVAAKVDGSNNPLNIEDGVYHTVKITWEKATNTLKVFFDGSQRVSYSEDFINTVFGGDATNIYWGFTAATGGFSNEQGVCGINMNFAPTTVADSYTVLEGGTINQAAPGVLVNDTDAEGGPLTAILGTTTTNGTLTLNANGSFTYVHNGSETTSDSFTYRVSDGSAMGSLVTVSITITPVNDAPTAVADSYTIAEGGTINQAAPGVLVNDTDAEGSAITAVLGTTTTNGTLTLNANGSFTYVHNGSETTSDSFTYRANDGTVSGTAVTVSITVTPVNDAPAAAADSYTIAEGGTINQAAPGVLVNDTDAEGSAITAVLGTTTTNGTLTLNANGSFTYVHNGSETTSDSFTYRANDGTVSGTAVTVSITVTPVNDAPAAVADSYTIAEGGTINQAAPGVLVNDTDAEGSAITAVLGTTTTNGTLTLNANGSFTYVHNGSETTSDSFTYRANDGTANGNTVTVSITITPVNDAPAAVADSYTIAEGGTINQAAPGILANDSDAEGSTLTTVLGTTTANGTLTLNANGSFTYVHNGSETTSDSFTYRANDGTANGNTVTVSITVTPVNDAPLAVADSYSVAEGGTINQAAPGVLANDTDAEGNALTAAMITTTANGTLTLNANGSFTYVHNGSETTSDSFTYRANDGTVNGNTVTVSITVTPVNDAPLAVADSYSVAEGGTINQAAPGVLANDTDAEGNALTAAMISTTANGTLTLNANGSFTYVHNGSETTSDSFTYRANDGTVNGNTVTVSITVTPVNDAPLAVADSYSVAEGGTINQAAPGVLANDTDAEGNALTAAMISTTANGTLTLNANGSFTYVHNGSETTSDSFTYRANDGTVNGNTVTVSITVTPVNDAPLAVADSYSVAEGGTINQAAPGVLANDTDAEGNALTAAMISTTANGTLTLNANGSFTYVHNGSETTSDSFTYRANDGTVNGNTVTVSITVTPVNDAPLAVADSYSVAEGGTINQAAPGVLANDTDAEGNALTAAMISTTANGTLTLNANGSFTYVHNGSETTSDSFTYRANDGTVNGNTVTVSITITPVNDAPLAVADSYSVAEGGTINQAAPGLLANDTDAEGNALTAAMISTTANGTLTLNANGSFTYVHNGSETTSDSFTYRANDGTVNGNTVTVSITITPVNDAPLAVADSYSVAEGGTINQAAPGVLANDTDAEGNALTAAMITTTANGTLTLNANGSFTYVHNGSETTSDSFTYRANDGTANGNTVTVSITVTPVNDAPLAVADSYSVAEGGTINQAAPGVLANDTDAEGNALTAAMISTTTNGTLTLNANGSFTYVHNGSETTSDSFTYRANDGTANGNTVTVSITITPVNDAPLAVADSYSVAEGGTINQAAPGVLANDTDAEGNALTAAMISTTANGTLTLNANGSFTYVHNGSETTSDSFTYRANDGTANGNTVTVSITITPVNDAPLAVADSYSVAEGGTINQAAPGVLANDTDAEGSALTAAMITTTANGTLTLNANGSFTYVHNGSETTSDSFTYRANDGTANGNTVTVSITITPVNDAPTAVADSYSVAEGGTINQAAPGVLANDSDAEGSAITAVLGTTTTNGTLTLNTNGSFTYVHNGSETTSDSFTYRANDGTVNGNTVTVSITITPVNDAPAAVADSYSVAEGGTINQAAPGVLVNDTDAEGSAITAVLGTTTTNGTLTLNANGSFTYVHNGSETTSDSFTYRANDGTANGNTVTVSITITPVNDAPTAVADSYTIAEGGTINQAAPGVLANDTDAEGSPITAVLGTTTTNGTLTLNANGSFTYVHNGSETTSDSFTYTTNDGTVNGNTVTVSITITPTNDAPVSVADSYTVAEGGTITEVAPGVLANDTDADGDALTTVLGTTTTNGTLTLNANGSFTYVHNGSATTSDSFTYRSNDGTTNGNLVTVSITITPVNDAPIAVVDSYIVVEGGTINEAAPGVLVNDTDAEGSPLTTVLTATTVNGTLTLNANGSFTYIHNGSETTSDSFTYSANDGTTNGNVVTVSITITPVNDAPTALNDNVSLTQDASAAITVLVNDGDVDNAVNAASITLVTLPANGTFSVSPTGVITYTPNPGYVGNDSFTYTIQDPSGLTSNIATVSITVTPINDPPIAVDDGPFIHENIQPLQIDVLANDSDPDNTNDQLTIVSVSNPLFGTVTIVNNQIIYQPSGTASGNDTFTYTIRDPDGLTSTAVVTIQYIYNPLDISEGFSPNGDASNDQWYIKGIENYPNNTIKVFDRWGLLVYQTKNYNNEPGWNGHANAGQDNGKLLDHGTYYYLLDLGTNSKTISGYITIVR